MHGWTWDPVGDDLQSNLDLLRTFVAREGHADVPEGNSTLNSRSSAVHSRDGGGANQGDREPGLKDVRVLFESHLISETFEVLDHSALSVIRGGPFDVDLLRCLT